MYVTIRSNTWSDLRDIIIYFYEGQSKTIIRLKFGFPQSIIGLPKTPN